MQQLLAPPQMIHNNSGHWFLNVYIYIYFLVGGGGGGSYMFSSYTFQGIKIKIQIVVFISPLLRTLIKSKSLTESNIGHFPVTI